MTQIKTKLSVKGIEEAIEKVNRYREWLSKKNTEFIERLIQAGIPVIETNVAAATKSTDERGIESGSDTDYSTRIEFKPDGLKQTATLFVQGREIAFIEFGAGVHFNGAVGSSPHPKGGELGMTIGSYGLGYGAMNIWGYVRDGEEHVTRGTPATMPLYKAEQEMIDKVSAIAAEVFGGGAKL